MRWSKSRQITRLQTDEADGGSDWEETNKADERSGERDIGVMDEENNPEMEDDI